VATVAKLMRSDRMVTLLRRIGELQDPETGEQEGVKIEEAIKEEPGAERGTATDEEYRLIVECNEIVGDVAVEAPSFALRQEQNTFGLTLCAPPRQVMDVHKFIRDHYATKFPELESLVPNALDYARVVQSIGNEMEMANINLGGILPSATIMVVSVTGSTTNGQPLEEEELELCLEACDELLKLDGE